MRATRPSTYLALLMSALLVFATGAIVARRAPLLALHPWSAGAFVLLALLGAAALTGALWQATRGRLGSGEALVAVALPVLAAVALAAGHWAAPRLGQPTPLPDATGQAILLIVGGVALGIFTRQRHFLAVWFAGVLALAVFSPFMWALLPRTSYWDARMLIWPVGIVVILHTSHNWPFALPAGRAWQLLLGLLGALWVLPPLVRLARLGAAPEPVWLWLPLMALLNWVLATLLLALPYYGWRLGLEWPTSPASRHPALASGLLALGGITLLEMLGAAAPWLPTLMGWLMLPYVLLLTLEALSIWAYQRRRAREAAHE